MLHLKALVALMCGAVLCVILTLGLWPFHRPANDVAWLAGRNGLEIGKHGTAISADPIPITSAGDASLTIEMWVQPRNRWNSGTLLTLYNRDSAFQFSLREWQTALALHAGVPDDPHTTRTARLFVDDVFPRTGSVFIAVVSGAAGTAVYINGAPARASAPRLHLVRNGVSAQLILAGAPQQTDSWSGQIYGLAIFNRELTGGEIARHALSGPVPEPGVHALYLFDERSGRVAHNKAAGGGTLEIPDRYFVVDKLFLEPVWSEFSFSRSYRGAVIKNVVGFVPFGFCFYAFFSIVCPVRRRTLVTVLAGTAASFTIEILQAYLPTRESGTTDLITNTLGTYIGVVCYRISRGVWSGVNQ